MNSFLAQNKEVLAFSFSLLGILLTFFFRGIREWRKTICLDCDSKRDVAVSILHDTFIHEATAHYQEVGNAVLQEGGEVLEIYRRPENQAIIKQLALSLEKSNQVKRYYTYLETASQYAMITLWVGIVLSACPIANIWLRVPVSLVWIWMFLLVLTLLGFLSAVTVLVYIDGRFFRVVNNIIKPEND